MTYTKIISSRFLPSKLLYSCAIAALVIPNLGPNFAFAQTVGSQPVDEGPVTTENEVTDDIGSDEIIVLGERLRGQVDTEQAPILELNPEDIAAYGASSVADLLTALEPQTGSSRGRGGGQPVILVNGVRIGSFRELSSYPPEAIQKVEVLPEETAQKFGYSPDRRVINFILKDNYSSITIAGEYEQPDRGGYSATEQEATLLKITKGGRFNLNVKANDQSMLTEAERGINQTEGSVSVVAGDPDPAEYRSLIADTASIKADANFAKSFAGSGTSLSLNGTFSRNDSRSLSGLDSTVLTGPGGEPVYNLLERRSRSDSFSSSGSLSQPLGDFILTVTADGTYTKQRTEIDSRINTSDGGVLTDPGFDIVNRKTYTFDSKATLRGPLFLLPAGEVNATIDTGYKWNRIESDDTRSGGATALQRGNSMAGFNLSVPLTSTRDDFLAAVGSITLNGQVGVNQVSDFGTLFNWSGGINWSPTDKLNLQATYTWREVQPSLSQLGDPQITTYNVPTFDFKNGETVLVTVISGGNPALKAETQSDWNFSANWEVIDGGRLQIGYSRDRSSNVSSSFPFLTPEIEAAFPDRVKRDDAGQLTEIDQRPVDFFQSKSQKLSFGFSMHGTIGKAPEPSTPPPSAGAGASGEGRGGGRGAGGEMSEERRAAMQAFRNRVCADDGLDFLLRLAAAADRGESLEEVPDFEPERAKRMLERFRAEDGSIDKEKLAGFRTMMCSNEGGPPGAASGSQAPRGGPRGRGGGHGGGRGGGMVRFGPGGGDGDNRARYFFNLTHNVELKREVLIAPGGPFLDLLNGDSLSSTGNARNSSRLEAGLFKGGFGIRLSGVYTGSARINGSGGATSTDLFVDDLATFNLRLFADMGTALKKEKGIFKGMRIAFRIDNVFDARRNVRDSNGVVPISYQPMLLDPVGRYIGIDVRKQF